MDRIRFQLTGFLMSEAEGLGLKALPGKSQQWHEAAPPTGKSQNDHTRRLHAQTACLSATFWV